MRRELVTDNTFRVPELKPAGHPEGMNKLALYPVSPAQPSHPWVLEGEYPPASGVWVVGRSPMADVQLTNTRVSKHHAEVRVTSIQSGAETCWFWEVQDTHSSNGTWINNHLIYPRIWTELAEADLLRLGGDAVLRVSFEVDDTSSGEAASTTQVSQPAKPVPAPEPTAVTHHTSAPWWAEWVESVWHWWTQQHPLIQWIMLVTTGGLAALLLWVWKL